MHSPSGQGSAPPSTGSKKLKTGSAKNVVTYGKGGTVNGAPGDSQRTSEESKVGNLCQARSTEG